MDDEIQLIQKEEETEEDTSSNVDSTSPHHHVVNELAGNITKQEATPQPLSDAGTSSTSQTLAAPGDFEPRKQPSLNLPLVHHGIDPPTYLQTIQQVPIPSENQYLSPSEPPPEYTEPSPGYNGQGPLVTAEEKDRTHAMEDELGRLTILQSVIRAMEEREAQNANGSERANQAQHPNQDVDRTPYGEIIIAHNDRSRTQTQQQTSTAITTATSPDGLPIITAETNPGGGRRQVRRIVIYQGGSPFLTAWRTYRLIRWIIFIFVVLIFGGGAGVGVYYSHRKSGSTGSHYDSVPSETKHHYGKINYLDTSTRIRCPHNHCENGGTCWQKDLEVECSCPPGYTGTYCNANIRVQCPRNICHNGGTCWKEGSTLTCECMSDYTGKHCTDRKVGGRPYSCIVSTCMNGGTCVDEFSSCLCPVGFLGDDCEIDIKSLGTVEVMPVDCGTHVCRNGGRCDTGGSGCVCPRSYYGSECQYNRS